MKLSRFFDKNKIGLQAQMSLFVTSAVLVVSAIVLTIIASLFRKEYERELNTRLSEAIASTTQFLEQKLAGMESSTRMVAELASLQLKNKRQIDTILCRSLASINDVQGVSLTVRQGYIRDDDRFHERCAWLGPDHKIKLVDILYDPGSDRFATWKHCYVDGESGWKGPVEEKDIDFRYVGYYTPLCDESGERIGLAYSFIQLEELTSMVTKYKARKDVDVSIYSRDGEVIVPPDEYILKLAPEDMILQERYFESLGWKVIFSADRRVIDGAINKVLLVLSLLIVLLFLTISAVIRLTVRFVAKPFVERQQRTEREKAVMDNEMQLAAGVQNNLVPHVFPPFPERDEIDLSACLFPARKVGGDMYDYFIQEDKLYFCIGDVSGKGVQASLFMAAMHYLFRSMAASFPVCEAAVRINRALCTDNSQCMFVTFWYGCLDLKTGMLEYVNAGHNSPILVRGGDAEYMPMAENMPLGVLEDAEFVSSTVQFDADDILFLYTDGITEAMDGSGREFGTEKTLDAVSASRGGSSSAIIENVLEKVRQYVSGTLQSDDITMLCLKIKTGATK